LTNQKNASKHLQYYVDHILNTITFKRFNEKYIFDIITLFYAFLCTFLCFHNKWANFLQCNSYIISGETYSNGKRCL